MNQFVSLLDRFWRKVDKKGPVPLLSDKIGRCWLWTGASDKDGYGTIRNVGKLCKAHRISWLLSFGDPGKMFVCHRCDNPRCVRPGHLFLGTHTDNQRDAWSKGRKVANRGESQWSSKLTASLVLEILASPLSTSALAERLGVHRVTVHDVRAGRTWRHMSGLHMPTTAIKALSKRKQ
jgi:hypothetical protein